MRLGINASRARSGGGVSHLTGMLGEAKPADYGIDEVCVWSYGKLLEALPDAPWLQKCHAAALEGALWRQLWWERFELPRELAGKGCDILLNVDAGSICRFSPAVTMSRDMLSYEPGEIERYGLSLARLRLIALRYVQNASLRKADGAIFLTRHAAETIQKSCGKLANIAYIPHGIGDEFKNIVHENPWPHDNQRPIRCLYVSNAAPYKHQWHVVTAVAALRGRGFDIRLDLVGGGKGAPRERLRAKVAELDPRGEFVFQHAFVPQSELPTYLANADLFIFASSCENMPNTLLEAMAAGLPIACSNRGPMPEVLEDGGVFFDPEEPASIAKAVETLLSDSQLSSKLACRAKELSRKYSWRRCADETFAFLALNSRLEG